MVILMPILLPILNAAQIDLVHFGIVMVTNLFIGALTPPIGNLAFIAAAIANEKPSAVFKALMPYMIALIGALLVLTYIPQISLFLPTLLRQ
jgi:C4-dicarboxylate transporter DctM subunit